MADIPATDAALGQGYGSAKRRADLAALGGACQGSDGARYKQVFGDVLRLRKDERRATEVAVAVQVLNHMLALGRPISVRIK